MTASNRLRFPDLSTFTRAKAAKKTAQSVAKTFEKNWRRLQSVCPDPDSQHRLTWLHQQFAKDQRGAKESAQAEIDVATFLVDAGFMLSFVKEAESRTADLECYVDHDRLFVEVTVIVPTELDQSKALGPRHGTQSDEESQDFWKDGLVKRMLARMNEKAEQLVDYCAPVVMALTLVHHEPRVPGNGKMKNRKLGLDLQQLGGVMTHALGHVSQLSGVLLTLWNMQPAESRSNIRLTNVYVGEWSMDGNGASRVRSFIVNPAADYPIEPHARDAIQRVL